MDSLLGWDLSPDLVEEADEFLMSSLCMLTATSPHLARRVYFRR